MGDERWGNAGQLSLLCGQPPVLAANILVVAVTVWGKSWGEPLDRIQSLCYCSIISTVAQRDSVLKLTNLPGPHSREHLISQLVINSFFLREPGL